MPHNIEKSAFRRGQYVGYGSGRVWRIERRQGGGWVAKHVVDGRDVGNPYVFARTLAEMSPKLENV